MKSNNIYKIPVSAEVSVGNLKLGNHLPVVIQSMANTDTNDVTGSVLQAKKIADAGGQMVRFTTQGLKEVNSLSKIVKSLRNDAVFIPIVADVHFSSKIATAAISAGNKVRINPGNFNEKKPAKTKSNNAGIQEDQNETYLKLVRFIRDCKLNHTAIRIGVNHGSLSERIMELYGDTPAGMVASAKEFLEICKTEDFHNVVVSIKSSNSSLMTKSVRLLVNEMVKENLYYPVHLGVTEAGNGLEGRIKSTVGIAPLLLEGIGDTIRISLTEPPENEIPVAKTIVEFFPKPKTLNYNPFKNLPWDPFSFNEFPEKKYKNSPERNYPLVTATKNFNDPAPDILVKIQAKKTILRFGALEEEMVPLSIAVSGNKPHNYIQLTIRDHPDEIAMLKGDPLLILDGEAHNIHEIKTWLITYYRKKIPFRIMLRKQYDLRNEERFAIKASGEFGFLLIDRLLDGIWIENSYTSNEYNTWLSYRILQAAGLRITATEYIACPSCGRTLFNIESVLEDVKKATSNLKGLKIAVMGCIVNGPGEMADADYGYIGAGRGLVNIYKGKNQVRKNVPEEKAINTLISVIKENGDWSES